jgi:hypothetical protein
MRADEGVEVRFRVIDFNLLCGIEGVTLNEPTNPIRRLKC